jgi:hypothetical protein
MMFAESKYCHALVETRHVARYAKGAAPNMVAPSYLWAWQVSMTDSLPWVPPWDPILEEKPASVLLAVRLFAGFVAPQCLQL